VFLDLTTSIFPFAKDLQHLLTRHLVVILFSVAYSFEVVVLLIIKSKVRVSKHLFYVGLSK